MKFYIVSYVVTIQKETGLKIIHSTAYGMYHSPAEAEGSVLREIRERFPDVEGYMNHAVTANDVMDEYIVSAYENLVKNDS